MKKVTLFLFVLIASLKLNAQSYSGKLGYGLSPEGFPGDFSQLPAFLTEVANTCGGGVVMGNGNWRDSLNGSGNLPGLHKFISNSQPSPYGYTDLLVFGWATYPTLYLDAPGNATNNWTNGNTKALFLQTLKSAADSLKPAYLFIGNEINFYWEQDSADFLNWAAFYAQAYDTIKAYSPATKVGTVYNYENLAGTGTLIGWNASRWGALTSMDTSKMDVIGFTVYPFFGNGTAAAVPLTYLDPLFNRIGNKPIVITETGWPADSTQPGAPWAASPGEQVTYVNKIFNIINGRNVEDVNWLFLNYLMSNDPANALFKSVALRDSLGNDRPALPVWLSMCGTSGAEELSANNEMPIYPNPATGNFTVELAGLNGEVHLTVRDILGHTIYDGYPPSNSVTVDMSQAKSGIYFVTATATNGKSRVKKLVKE